MTDRRPAVPTCEPPPRAPGRAITLTLARLVPTIAGLSAYADGVACLTFFLKATGHFGLALKR